MKFQAELPIYALFKALTQRYFSWYIPNKVQRNASNKTLLSDFICVFFSPDVEVSRGPQCEHEGGCRGGWLGDRPRLWGTVHFLVHASSLKELFWCRFCVLERRIGAGAKVGSQNHRRFWTHKGTHQVKMPQNSIFCSFCLTMNPYLDWGGTCELEWVLKQEEEVRAEACEASSLS